MKNSYNWPCFLSRILLLFLISMFTVNLLWPEETEEPDIEIVVTADRMETKTTKIPAHVTVITAEELQAKGKETIVEALEEVAGVSFRSTNGNPARAEISMRGFGENSHGRVLVLLDGRKLNQPDLASINWLQIPIENIERIEVVRGGASTLYGDHAVGGVINIITKKGSPKAKLDTFASGGSFFGNQERLGVTGTIGPFDLALNAEHTGTEGYREHSALESLGTGMEVGLSLTDSFYSSLKFSYEWLYCELPGCLTKTEMEEDPTQIETLYSNDETENNHLNSMLTFKALLGEWGQLDTEVFYNLKLMKDDMVSWTSFSNKYLHSFGASPRLSADFSIAGCANNLIVGTDLAWDIYDSNRYNDVERNTKDFAILITKNSYGIYVSDELSLLDTLHLKAGIRYEFAQIAADVSLGTDIDNKKIYNVLVWNAGFVWEFLSQAKLYSRFETVYRYPFIDEQVIYAGWWPDDFNEDLEAEHGYNIEAGSTINLFDKLFKLNLNVFYLEIEDEIAPNNVAKRNENMDRTRRIGGEAVAEINIEDFLIISVNYTYTYATFIAGVNEGKFIPLVPEHDAFVEAALYLPWGFSLGSSLNYRGECYQGGDFNNKEEKIADYFLLNAFIKYIPNYIPGKLQIMFHLENILNEHYATSVYYGGYYPEPGFNWKISVSYGIEL
jgi:iron complex outermembrane receptor protein